MARKTLATSHAQHERLQDLIASNPGIHVRKLSQLVGMSWNTCLHHLRTMESDGRVLAKKVQGKVCYFDKSTGVVEGKEATCLLRDPDNLRLARSIMDRPGRKQVEIAADLGMATSSVHRRVSRLEEAGLIERMHMGRSMHVMPADHLPNLAAAADESILGDGLALDAIAGEVL